ncbi:MAG TPA: Ig-like domain-containing protein [Verrucomicrobiae bacterium]|nr:Ig-like domain-containing protein [Verrucomicrobiae bacterium]
MNACLAALATVCVLAGSPAWAQSTTVSSNPADGATGVSRSASIVFTFSAAMDTSSQASFYSLTPAGAYPVTSVWSAGNTVLTCTPVSSFPASTTISWVVGGQDANGGQVFGQGTFTTGTSGGGGGGGGSGTNAITTFSAGKLYYNEQLTSGPATPMADFAYAFTASTSLASNRTATAVTVTVPNTASPKNLTQNFSRPEDYFFFDYTNNAATFESLYPEGSYGFSVTGTPNNLQGTVTLPTTMLQPNAPHVSNFDLAQTIDATKDFTLTWDPFTNGTASDFISVAVSDNNGKTLFQTPGPGTNGALNGTAKSVVIKAGKLTANTSNSTAIVFYRWTAVTNATYASVAFRATETQLELVTTGGAASAPPTVSNPSWSPNGLSFDVGTSANQVLTVRFTTDLSLPVSQWQKLFTTNSPGASVHLVVPKQAGSSGFIRLQNGP